MRSRLRSGKQRPKLVEIGILDDDIRRRILDRYPPIYDAIYCKFITFAYDVDDDHIAMRRAVVEIVGEHHGDGTQAVLCCVNGHLTRPDGRPYVITISTAADIAPARAGEFDTDEVNLVDDVIAFDIATKVGPARRAQPEWRT